MCLAVPARVIECGADDALVDLQGNRLRVSLVLAPEAGPGDWVLVHAGFAIATIDERDALETWEYLSAIDQAEIDDAADATDPRGAAERDSTTKS